MALSDTWILLLSLAYFTGTRWLFTLSFTNSSFISPTSNCRLSFSRFFRYTPLLQTNVHCDIFFSSDFSWYISVSLALFLTTATASFSTVVSFTVKLNFGIKHCDMICIAVLWHSDSFSVISWQWYDVWDEEEPTLLPTQGIFKPPTPYRHGMTMRGTGLWWCSKLYTMRKWIPAQLNVMAVTGFVPLSPVTNPVPSPTELSLHTTVMNLHAKHIGHLSDCTYPFFGGDAHQMDSNKWQATPIRQYSFKFQMQHQLLLKSYSTKAKLPKQNQHYWLCKEFALVARTDN